MSLTHVLTSIKADISSRKRTLFNFSTLSVHEKAVKEEEGYEQQLQQKAKEVKL